MQPIGVFDSGMGGLTVLKALRQRLPEESFVYLGDTARLPYGSKSAATVSRYAIAAAQHLLQAQVKLIVVACNTASAVALNPLRDAFAPIPVLGVVEPGAHATVQRLGASNSGSVLVLATESTVRGGAYARALHRLSPHLRVHSRACSLLVALAEEGRVDGPVVDLVLRDYLAGYVPLAGVPATTPVQSVLLGCTHFPVFTQALRRLLPADVQIVDSANTTAAAVAEHLGEPTQPASAGSDARLGGELRFLATDGVARFARVGPTFFGAPITAVEQVDL